MKKNNGADFPDKYENGTDRVYTYKDIQWEDLQNPHFINWMRTAGLPTFSKLYGIIYDDLQAGQYQLKIKNNFDVSEWKGYKAFTLT